MSSTGEGRHSTRRPVGTLLTCAAAAVTFAAAAIVVPAPRRWLLPVAVGAPELSSWILIVAALVFVLAVRRRPARTRTTVLGVMVFSGAVALVPLLQIPAMTREIDERLAAALGSDYLAPIPANVRSGFRSRALDPRALLFGLRTGEARITRHVPFASHDDATLTLDVYQPPASGAPVIIQIYGGAWQRGAPSADPTLATYLASRGYVVFAIDYRHAPRWRWPAQLEDMRDALEWVHAHASEYGGDASKVAVLGRSSGAQLALMLAYTNRSHAGAAVRGVISLYGPTDLTRGYRELPRPDPIGVQGTLEALLGGSPDAIPARYTEASPVTYASARQPPTMQIIGGRDHVVRAVFARSLDQRLREAGNVSVLLELPWSEHAFDAVPFGPGAQLTLYATERFLAHVLTTPE